MPGWDPLTWGYHGDDGNKFHARGYGRPYGQLFGTGDVVGCRLNLRDAELSFTKNGVSQGKYNNSGSLSSLKCFLQTHVCRTLLRVGQLADIWHASGLAFKDVRGRLFPVVAIRDSRGAQVRVNFGARPFNYRLL
jgi:SPRY domain